MSGPACPCLTIAYTPREHTGGAKSDRWTCASCGAEFVRAPVAASFALPPPPSDGLRVVFDPLVSAHVQTHGDEDGRTFTVRPHKLDAALALAYRLGCSTVDAFDALREHQGDEVAATEALRRKLR